MAQGSSLIVRDNTDLSRGSSNQGQPAYPVPPDQYMSPSQVRDLFLQTAIEKSLKMDPFAYPGSGQSQNMKVPQTGLGKRIRLFSQLTVASAAALVAAPTAKAPYSLFANILYTDPSGNMRINSPAWELYLLMSSKKSWGWEESNGNVGSWTAPAAVTAQVFNNPTPAVAAANVRFFVDLPLCMSDHDTRGGILLESATSPSFITLTHNANPMDANATASVDSPYTNNAAATTLTLAGNVAGIYYFWQPTYVRGPHGAVLPLPTDDLNVVHEIVTQKNSTALNANSENRYTFQTGRSYYRVIMSYVRNNALESAALTDVRFAYDNANYTLQEHLQGYYSRIRHDFDRDLPPGTYLFDFTKRPWDSNHYGQLDSILVFDGSSLAGTTYVDNLRECLYMAPIA